MYYQYIRLEKETDITVDCTLPQKLLTPLFVIVFSLLFPLRVFTQAPTVVSVTPIPNSPNEERNVNLTVTFSLGIFGGTFSNNTVRIDGSLSGMHSGVFGYNSGTHTGTINPNTDFMVGEKVDVMVTRGVRNEISGDSLASAFGWSFTVESEAATGGTFNQAYSQTVGDHPYSIVAGDFNGDGTVDLAAASHTSENVSILLNDGDGGYSLSSVSTEGMGLLTITAGDLDGDGDMDLVTTGGDSISVLLNNGSGAFSQDSSLFALWTPGAVAIADVDGDRDLDVVVSGMGNPSLAILLNDGSASFMVNTTSRPGNTPRDIIAGDFDGDGHVDLAVANTDLNNVIILANDGHGAFAQSSAVSVGDDPVSLAMGDFNGDGSLDLAVSNGGDNTVSILSNDGNGAFTVGLIPDVEGGMGAMDIIAGDFNGDGDIDLAVAHSDSNNIYILDNDGDGGFGENSILSVGSYTRAIVAADLNGDGTLDLAAATWPGTVTIFNKYTLPPTIMAVTPIPNSLNEERDENITVTFSQDMDAATFTNSTVRIDGSVSGMHNSVFEYDSNTRTATINPNLDFQVGERVHVSLTRGIRSTLGDSLASAYVWGFTVNVDVPTSGTFSQVSTPGVGSGPRSISTGDLDGDGDPDLATANSTDDNVSILLNNGSGTFTQNSTAGVGNCPMAICAGDFDGDGDRDLATCNYYDASVTILLNQGGGTFSPGSTIGVGNVPYDMTSGDFDGDGDIDLATADYNDSVISVLLNNGNGTFTRNSSHWTEGSPQSVTAGDFDGDGDIDIAAANYQQNTAAIFLNNGTGIMVRSYVLAVGDLPVSVTAGDFDGDGDLDLAVANNSSHTVSILSNPGTGAFAVSATVSVGNSPQHVTCGDLDGDGDIDLAVANYTSNTISILLNDGSGTFTQSSASGVGTNPFSIAIGDFNGDGDLDIADANAGSNTVTILKNYFPPAVDSFIPVRNAQGIEKSMDITIEFSQDIDPATLNSTTVRLNGSLSGLHPAAISYDPGSHSAKIDPDEDFRIGESVSVMLTAGIQNTGGDPLSSACGWSFLVKSHRSVGQFNAPITLTTSFNYPYSIAAGDWNKDGTLDIATANYGSACFNTYRNTGAGTFSYNSLFLVGAYPAFIIAGDWNADGMQDLITINASNPSTLSIATGNEIGGFTVGPANAIGFKSRWMCPGDYNGDGMPDMAVADETNHAVRIYLNTGSGSFTLNSTTAAGGNTPYSIAAGDWNGDGWLDLATANYGSNTMSVLLNNTHGGFSVTSTVGLGSHPYSITPGDWNKDGALDVAVTNNGSNTVYILINNGSGNFTVNSTVGTGAPTCVQTGDFDGDGYPDLVVAQFSNNTVAILRNNDGAGFLSYMTIPVQAGPIWVKAGDWNDDGLLDVAVANSNSYSVSIANNVNNLAPPGLLADEGNGQVTLIWNKSAGSDIAGYRIYLGTSQYSFSCADSTIGGISDTTKTITGLVNGTTYFFRVTAVDEDRCESGYSNEVSAVPSAPSIAVASPNGGESWGVGSSHDITWTSSGTSGNVKIEYSTNNGSTWTVVIASTLDDGLYTWTVPNTPSTNCLVRISDTDGIPGDQSDAVFSIINLETGLVAWYLMNGTVNDSSGNGNDGTNGGAVPVEDRFGNVGGAYSFNGSSQITAATTGFPTGNGPRSISFWMKTSIVAQYNRMLVGWGDASQAQMSAVAMYNSFRPPGTLAWWGFGSDAYSNGWVVHLNQWQHVLMTYSSDDTVKIYIDGVLDWKAKVATTLITPSGTILYIGNFTNTMTGFTGSLDDVRIYDRVLGVDEVRLLYNQEDYILVETPNGSENWFAGSVHDITWTSSSTSGNVKIEYSTNNGSAWTDVIASTSDDGSYAWTIPDSSSENCLVRVSDLDGNPSDVSDAVFTIFITTYTDIETASIGSPIYFNEGGDDPGDGHTIDMTFTSLTGSGNVTVLQTNIAPPNAPCQSACGFYWVLNTDAGISDFSTTITFHYTDDDMAGFTESGAFLGIAKFNASTSTWTWLGGTVDAGANTITVNGVTSFSDFALFRRIFGDCTGDGYVDASDLQRLGDCWHDTNSGEFTGGSDARFFNFNKNMDGGNQIIDAADLQVFGDCWHNGAP